MHTPVALHHVPPVSLCWSHVVIGMGTMGMSEQYIMHECKQRNKQCNITTITIKCNPKVLNP